MKQRLYTLVAWTLVATITGPATGFGTSMVVDYIQSCVRTGTFSSPLPMYAFLFFAYMFGGPVAAFPGAFSYGLALALMPPHWLTLLRARGRILAAFVCGLVLGGLCGLVSAWVWHNVTGGPYMPTFGFFPFIVGGSISGLLCFLVYAPPNPSLNADARRRACARASVAG
jgi:hypothetical protein